MIDFGSTVYNGSYVQIDCEFKNKKYRPIDIQQQSTTNKNSDSVSSSDGLFSEVNQINKGTGFNSISRNLKVR